jgi:hypothetical protein
LVDAAIRENERWKRHGDKSHHAEEKVLEL